MSSDNPSAGFPGRVLETLHLLVVRDVIVARDFYVGALGATVLREDPGSLVFLDLAGCRLVLSVPGGPTQDKPTVRFTYPADPDTVTAEVILRVSDVAATFAALTERGVRFLTPPVTFPWETRCYLRDPDGHLIELTQPPAVGGRDLSGDQL